MTTWPPPRSSRRDPLADAEPPSFPWAARLLVLSIAVWLVATAAADVTSPAVAQPAIARLLDSLIGTSSLLDADADRLRQSATKAAPGTLVEVPGFPVNGAGIPREDVLSGTPEQWRAILLDRSAALVYRDGTGPFSAEGQGGGGPLALRLLGERLHGWFRILRWFPGLATLGLGMVVAGTLPPVRRWRAIGLAMALGAALPLVGTCFVLAIASLSGGPSETLSGEAAAVVATLTRGPIIQSVAVAVGGLVLWWRAGRSRSDEETAARLDAARAARDARRRAVAGLPPEPRRTVR